MKLTVLLFSFLAAVAFNNCGDSPSNESSGSGDVQPDTKYVENKNNEQYEVATFAGGCFWCTEASFERIKGVEDVISGYAGGEQANPSYEEVARGSTDHAESIQVFYDPQVIDYSKLLEIFFVAHDPTQLNRQGPDVGRQYRSAIFYHNEEQKKLAENYMEELNQSGKFTKEIVTELVPLDKFWVAEDYHQNYYELHPDNRYIQSVSRPKVEKVMRTFSSLLKEKYK